MPTHRPWRLALLILLAGLAPALSADRTPAPRSLSVMGLLGNGESLHLGRLQLDAPDANGRQAFRLDLDAAPFVDKFLSMRPFKCLDSTRESLCHLPYPYSIRNQIDTGDLADLDYQLLFIFKTPEQYHAEFFNGLYFRFRRDGEGFVGVPHEVNMNLLMAPPAEGDFRPIRASDLVAIDAGSHWLQGIEIR